MTSYAWPAGAAIVVHSVAVAIGVVVVVVLLAVQRAVGAATILVGRRLPLCFLRHRTHDLFSRGCGPDAPAPRFALVVDEGTGAQRLADADLDELVAEASAPRRCLRGGTDRSRAQASASAGSASTQSHATDSAVVKALHNDELP